MSQTHSNQGAPNKPMRVSDTIERMLNKSREMRARAASAPDADWRQFYESSAAAYTQWAVEMQAVDTLQARVEAKTTGIRRQFGLDRHREQFGGARGTDEDLEGLSE
jgi:hypothetical protein